MVDLPCIIEAQKTLDFSTFYKSCDAAQMMYVHNKSLDHAGYRTPQEIAKFVSEFNPVLEDEEFHQGLYQRKKLKQRIEQWEASDKSQPLMLNDLKWRHGLAPGAHNVRNVRHKVDQVVDPRKVHEVEVILKNLIETGFADNCDEELLEFNDEGKLVKVTKGVTPENQRQQQVDLVMAYKD